MIRCCEVKNLLFGTFKNFLDIIPDMERIAESTPEDFYTVVRQVQQRIAELVEGYNSQ